MRCLPSLRPRTLSAQLTIRVSATVAVALLAVGLLSIYTSGGYANALIDIEVIQSLRSLEHSLVQSSGDGQKRLTDYTGQSSGTLIAVQRDGQMVDSAMFDDDGARELTPVARSALATVDLRGNAPRSVDIAGLGEYRVASLVTESGDRLVSAKSLRAAHQAVATRTALVMAITAAVAVLVAVGTVVLVRKTLKPLRRVAATAASVATISLTDDGQRVTARVGPSDTNPDNEVGIVGATLNRLLDNVDDALATRSESDRRMRRFLTDASHELRTPLATIRGYAELTRQDGPLLPETTEYALARIESEARRMTTLVDDMFLLTRLDERHDLHFAPVDLYAVLTDAVNDIAVTTEDHTFTVLAPEGAVWVDGDRTRLHQVLKNLLSNAIIHTPPGTTVSAEMLSNDQYVEIAITDDGPGIDADLLPDLFERFVRADKARSRARDSTGLGLAIVESIVKAHRGTVSVQSSSAGTTFTVRLPHAKSSPPSS